MTKREENVDAFEVTDVSRVRRYSRRGRYDRGTVFGILDGGLVAHVAFIHDDRPVVIPMTYGHDRERLFLHGARKGRIGTATAGEPVSIGVTLVDGIVVGRSLFDSSMNYRSVVLHGRIAPVTERAELLHGLRCIVEHMMPGRWNELPLPTAQELAATVVLALEIETASAKVRAGAATDPDDGESDVWSGVVPVTTSVGSPLPDPGVRGTTPVPASVLGLATVVAGARYTRASDSWPAY